MRQESTGQAKEVATLVWISLSKNLQEALGRLVPLVAPLVEAVAHLERAQHLQVAVCGTVVVPHVADVVAVDGQFSEVQVVIPLVVALFVGG